MRTLVADSDDLGGASICSRDTHRAQAVLSDTDARIGHARTASRPRDVGWRSAETVSLGLVDEIFAVELIACEVGTWRELARRPSPFPISLAGGPSMLGNPIRL
jgi:hypothetical protein